MAKKKQPLPFTREFAQAVCKLYTAAAEAADAAGAMHIVEVYGEHIHIGARDEKRIDLRMCDELIELAWGEQVLNQP